MFNYFKCLKIYTAILVYMVFLINSNVLANTGLITVNASVSFDSTSRLARITGNISSGEGQLVTIRVINPNGGLSYANQITSSGNGAFDASFSVPKDLFGTYEVYIGGGYGVGLTSTTFTYNLYTSTPTPTPSSSGDGSGGGSTPTPTATPTPKPTEIPVQTPVVEGGTVKMPQPKVDENGTALVEVPALLLEKAIEAVESSDSKTVTVLVPGVDRSARITVRLPGHMLSIADTEKVERIDISTEKVSITFTPDAFGKDAAASKIDLSVEEVKSSDLPLDVASLVGDKPVFDISASIDAKQVNKFKNSKAVKVSMNYEPAPGEDPGKILIYHINEKGKTQVVKNSKYDPASSKVAFYAHTSGRYAAVYVNTSFSDISAVNWAKGSIEALAAREIVNGVGDSVFAPNNKVTRAEFIKMIIGAFDLGDESAVSSFKDVKSGEWYYPFIASAQKLGIVNGYEDGTFGVGKEISRQEMAAIAYRAAAMANVKLVQKVEAVEFIDRNEIQQYSLKAITAMQQAGIINGMEGNRFAPVNSSTRAEAAKIVYGLFKYAN